MYEVYKTRAIIFSKKKYLEKSKKIVIFSEDFGFINVVAHGIFLEKSKNKSILQLGNLSDIYIVRGKNKWIISGGKVIDNIFFSFGKEALESLYLNMDIIKKNSIFDVVQKDIFNFVENKYFFNKKELELVFKKKQKKELSKKLSVEFNLDNSEKILKLFGYLDSTLENNVENRINNVNNILKNL